MEVFRSLGLDVKPIVNAAGRHNVLWWLNATGSTGSSRCEIIEIGRKYNILVMADAAQVPPAENLYRPIDMGADLLCFSGGEVFVDLRRVVSCCGHGSNNWIENQKQKECTYGKKGSYQCAQGA